MQPQAHAPADLAASFLASALTPEERFIRLDEVEGWLAERARAQRFAVRRIRFDELDQWHFAADPHRLVHDSGRFFAIEGVRVETSHGPVRSWQQPIIHQPEIGILGILTRCFDGVRYFLMQAKREPGNPPRSSPPHLLQLSPTVQATWSNYTRVHAGKRPRYLDYFLDPSRGRRLIDQLQSEQGSRFLRKRNRNMIVEIDDDVPLADGFVWLTLGQIKRLLGRDNLVNMDARTVLACIPFASASWQARSPAEISCGDEHAIAFGRRLEGFPSDLLRSAVETDRARHSSDEILSWLTEHKAGGHLKVERIPLDQVADWKQDDYSIRHRSGQHFAVIAVDVEAGDREVVHWTQPLLEHFGCGCVGFVTQKHGGILHFLVRASLEPGNRDLFEIGPTVACANPEQRLAAGTAPPFLELFQQPPTERIRYQAVQSEEGGRFYHFQNRYTILELEPEASLEIPPDFTWMTLAQIFDLARHGLFNIEARNLLSCLNLQGTG
ncbi:MAG: NDP-hexose 2,3-dehydratase family protein [Acidobacteriota bacterium]